MPIDTITITTRALSEESDHSRTDRHALVASHASITGTCAPSVRLLRRMVDSDRCKLYPRRSHVDNRPRPGSSNWPKHRHGEREGATTTIADFMKGLVETAKVTRRLSPYPC